MTSPIQPPPPPPHPCVAGPRHSSPPVFMTAGGLPCLSQRPSTHTALLPRYAGGVLSWTWRIRRCVSPSAALGPSAVPVTTALRRVVSLLFFSGPKAPTLGPFSQASVHGRPPVAVHYEPLHCDWACGIRPQVFSQRSPNARNAVGGGLQQRPDPHPVPPASLPHHQPHSLPFL